MNIAYDWIIKHWKCVDLLGQTSLIIWNKVFMQHKHCSKTIYDLLLNIYDDINPFGRVTMVFESGFC
jgi:hypothetical protein